VIVVRASGPGGFAALALMAFFPFLLFWASKSSDSYVKVLTLTAAVVAVLSLLFI